MNTLLNKKILVVEIVEDEESMLRPMTDVLTAEGFHVLQARNGEEGLKEALDEKPDLILLDILMPNMDGMTMMKKLRENNWGKKVKIIILTNLQADEAIMKGIIRDEPTYYFVKADWQIGAVLKKVKEVLGVSQ